MAASRAKKRPKPQTQEQLDVVEAKLLAEAVIIMLGDRPAAMIAVMRCEIMAELEGGEADKPLCRFVAERLSALAGGASVAT